MGSSLAIENAAGAEIKTYCILDSNYHFIDQFKELQESFRKRGVELHIWEMKEIENYLLVPSTIKRAIMSRLPKRATKPTVDEIKNFLNVEAKKLRENMFDSVSQEILSFDRSIGVSGANKKARGFIKSKESRYGLIGSVSGKDLMSRLFEWAKAEFGVSLNKILLAQTLHTYEISSELKSVLTSIESLKSFKPQQFDW